MHDQQTRALKTLFCGARPTNLCLIRASMTLPAADLVQTYVICCLKIMYNNVQSDRQPCLAISQSIAVFKLT